MLNLFEEPKEEFEEQPPVVGITKHHVRLIAWITLFVVLLVGICSVFKMSHVGFIHISWGEILILLIFIPALWFGLWCAWKSK